jgi:potassium efflux system protein
MFMVLSVRFIRFVCLTFLITTFVCVPVSAQESLPDKSEIIVPEDSESEVQAIPLEAVSDRASRTGVELGTLLPTEESRQMLKRIDLELALALPEVDSLLSEIREALAGQSETRILQELESKTSRILKERIQPWIKELDDQLTGIQSALQQTDKIVAVWAKTSAEVNRQDSVALNTVTRIVVVRGDIDKARLEIIEHRNRILAVRDNLVIPGGSLEAFFKQLHKETGARIKSIFGANRLPLWSPLIRESLHKEWIALAPMKFFHRLQKDAGEQATLLRFQLLLFVTCAFILFWLRSRVRTTQAESNYDLHNAREVFELPLAMALLITASFTTPLQWLGTSSVSFIVIVLFGVAILAIIRRFLIPATAPLVWGLMIIAIFDRVALDLLDSSPTLEHIVFLIETIAALGFLLLYLRLQRKTETSPTAPLAPFLPLLNSAMQLAAVVLAVAIFSDLIGWSDLARVLRTGILSGGYASIAVYVLLLVFESLVTFALLFRPLSLLRIVSRNRQLIRQRIERWLKILAIGLWAVLVLRPLGLLDLMLDSITRVFSATTSIGALSVSMGDIMAFVLITWFSFLLARFVNFVLREDVFTRVRTGRGVPQAIAGLVRYSLIFIGFFIALAAAGIELTKLSIIAGGLGVGIGFGLQNVVNNFVSGLILLFERPIGVGDIIELPDIWGEMKRIGMRASVIRKFDGSEVIVPNSMLVSDKVVNWTLSDKHRRLELDIGVEYGTPAQHVIDLLIKVAESNPNVISEPPPRAFFMNFGDSALEFRLWAWVDVNNGFSIRSELAVAAQEALRQAGISVPFPQRDLHLVSVNKNEISDPDKGVFLSPNLTPDSGSHK